MAEKYPQTNKDKSEKTECIPDSDTSDEEQQLNPHLCTSVEEWEYSTIPGSVAATRAALSYSTAQTNPTVKRGIPHKTKVKKLPKEKAKDKASQTDSKDK